MQGKRLRFSFPLLNVMFAAVSPTLLSGHAWSKMLFGELA